jgi:hypothetical protein
MSERHSPCFQSIAIILVCIFCALAFSCFAGAQSSAKPFSKDDVVQLLKGSVSAKRVGELAQTRGIEFQITPEVETELRQLGATDELLSTLHRLAPRTATLVIESSPGSAHVYVDDEPVGTTSSEGRLKLSTLGPGQHRVRLSLDGYRDDSQDVALAAGAVLELKVTLEANQQAGTAETVARAEPSSPNGASGSPQQEAVVCIFRPTRFGATGVHPEIFRDGVSLGQLHNGKYFTLALSAGRHSFASTESRVDLDVQDGGVYYIEVSLGPSSGGRLFSKAIGKLTVVSNEIGEAEIKDLNPR